MSKHNVRGTASGEYECSCGARWDRDEGDECPLGRIDGKQVKWQNETMENARVAALNGTLPELKEVVSAGDREALIYLMGCFDNEVWVCPRCSHEQPTNDMDSASYLREYLAGAQPASAGDERPIASCLRGQFETWAMETEHPVFGCIGSDWLDHGDDPNTYANDYMQGAWVMWQARAALSANHSEQVPEGWKLVPVEPTPEILRAMQGLMVDVGGFEAGLTAAYRAAIAAALSGNHTEKQAKDAPYMSDDADARETWAEGYNAAMRNA